MPNKPRALYKLSLIFILKAFSIAATAPPTPQTIINHILGTQGLCPEGQQIKLGLKTTQAPDEQQQGNLELPVNHSFSHSAGTDTKTFPSLETKLLTTVPLTAALEDRIGISKGNYQ